MENLRVTAYFVDGSAMDLDYSTSAELVEGVLGDDTGRPVRSLVIAATTDDGQEVTISASGNADPEAHVRVSEPEEGPLEVKSTSRSSAECSDIPIRTKGNTRLIFRSLVVDNKSDVKAGIKGALLYQRKAPGEEWEDTSAISLASLKGGEGVKLSLSSSEVRRLFETLEGLYQLQESGGVPRGTKTYIPQRGELARIARMAPKELVRLLATERDLGVGLLSRLVAWASGTEDPAGIVRKLVELDAKSVTELQAAIGVQALRKVLDVMKSKLSSSNEEEWQRLLTEHSFVLEHAFLWPSTIVKGKAYMGGKNVLNEGGSLVDFLLRNRLTRHAALVEIKTPATSLLGREYRNGVFNVSEELSGSVMQVLNYKATLLKEGEHLLKGLPVEAFEPPCAVIIGNAGAELGDSEDKRKSFELFRANTSGVDVFTFDELIERTSRVILVLESGESSETA